MRRLLLLLSLLFVAAPALAERFNVPGLAADSSQYYSSINRRTPAGSSTVARRVAENRAAEAEKRGDWPVVVDALEARLGGGDPTAPLWLALGRAQLRRTPPNPARAAQAAWQAFTILVEPKDLPALLLMADAFRAQDRPDYVVAALEAVAERSTDPSYTRQLTEARRVAGIMLKTVKTEPEADPPSACITFTTAPARRADFVAADWVRLEPAQPTAAVTREGDQICIAGLRLSATTQVILRAGMPGEDGLKLIKDLIIPVAMGNREPRLIIDSRMFLLPRGQAASITLSTINLSIVHLKLMRMTERNIVGWSRQNKIGESLDRYGFEAAAENGKLVWDGTAEVPHWQPNQLMRFAVPLPDVFQEPGAYILLATPADGTPEDNATATQLIMRTDLAPSIWRGTDGLTVQVRSFADAAVRAGANVRLLSRSNDILAEAVTDADGVVRFAAPLLQGTGPQAPQSVHVLAGTELVALDLTAAAFDLSDRGVEGARHPGPLDAFAWTDRGIYRPGETVQLMALLRDASGAPQDVPAHVVVKRPNGQVFLDQVPPRGAEGAIHLPIVLSPSAPAGEWSVEVLADPKRPAIGNATFHVDAFVPDRMAVDLSPQGSIVVGQPYSVPVVARFLYGAPAANLTGKATLHLVRNAVPPDNLAGYRIGLEDESFAPEVVEMTLPPTDAQGRTTLPIMLETGPDTTFPVIAELTVSVDDPSGRASQAQASIHVRPSSNQLGIKTDFTDGIDAGGEAGFEFAAVDPGGLRATVPARMRLVRERPDWRLVQHGSIARYEMVYRDEPIEAADIVLQAETPYAYKKRLDFGRYRLEVTERGGLGAVSIRFRAGWVASDSPDTPDKVDVSTDRKNYKPGDTARVHVMSPFAGQATLLMLTDRVHSLRDVEVPAGGADFDVPVEAAWGPGAYATIHVFRGPSGNDRPARAIGLVWIGIDPATRTLAVAIDAPEKVLPRVRTTVPVRTAPGAWVTMAAVDEGVLRLTSFVSPDPAGHFLGRRTLGLDIRDDWGRLIAPAEGEATVLKQGGDIGGSGLAEIPQKVVALFTPPVQAGADGVAQVPLDLPDFSGQVRLMVVAWQGTQVGAASRDMLVRDPLIAEPLLPRFLAPGDEARLAVLLQNVDLPQGEAVAVVSVEGPLALAGETRLAATLATGAQVVRTTTLRATGAGRGVIRLAVTGPGGFQVQREAAIIVRPSRAPTSIMTTAELPARGEVRLVPALAQMVAGTGVAQARFGGLVRYDPAALLQALASYPLSCLEQTSSRGFPLALFPDGATAGPDRAGRLQAAVWSVLDRQRYDGGFGLWSASSPAETWLSAYATEFLLRSKKAGAAVPDGALRDALKFIGEAANEGGSEPKTLATKAYDLYVLALAGQPRAGANRIMAEDLDKLPTPLALAQLAAALALSNDRPRAEAAFTAVLAFPARRYWDEDRGTALRDQAAVTVLLKESGLLPERLAALVGALPGADLRVNALSTQEQAWVAAAAAVLGRDGQTVHVSVDGRDIPAAPAISIPLTAAATVRNLEERSVWQSVSTTGVTTVPAPAAQAGMRVTRSFFTLAGIPMKPEAVKQNTVFVMLVEGRADDSQDHRAMMLQGLPAGWEIAGRLVAGSTAGMPWLGLLTEVEAQPAADDQFATTILLTEDVPKFRVAVRLRAVTPGVFELPGAYVADMYRPAIFARQATIRARVLAPE